jgi:S-(hydroxymethyl)glutathione dehydrogenase / alcohol dehydrogenase
MKAAVLHAANQPMTIEEVAVNKPGPREVLLRTAFAGLGHSDLHFMEGLYPHPTPASWATNRPRSSRRSATASPT